MAEGDYEWYITLAELQNVTAAADQLRLAQPTLTRMLARLERRLGVRLFDRHGKRLALNPFGRIFYQHARRAQLELDSARRAIDDLANPAEGEIRLGFLHTFGPTLIAGLIAGFATTSPHVRFVLEQAPQAVSMIWWPPATWTSPSSLRALGVRISAGATFSGNVSASRCPPTIALRKPRMCRWLTLPTNLSWRCIQVSVCVGCSKSSAPQHNSNQGSCWNQAI